MSDEKDDKDVQATAALVAIGGVLEFVGQPTHQTARVGEGVGEGVEEVSYQVIGTTLRKGGERWGAFVRVAGSTKAPVWCGYWLGSRDAAKAACQHHYTTGNWY